MAMKSIRRKNDPSRRGAALVEFVICLPLLLLLLFGTFELCDAILLEETLSVSAYEGARETLRGGATVASVQAASQAILTSRGIQGWTVEVIPTNFDSIADGQYIEVRVTAPVNGHVIGLGQFFKGGTLHASSSVMKEY